MRVGIISPNALLNVRDHNAMFDESDMQWPFETIAKRSAFAVDKIFVTDDLDITLQMIGSASGQFDDDPLAATVRHLADEGFLLSAAALGLPGFNAFAAATKNETVSALQAELLRLGNPAVEPKDAELLIGQPEAGAWAESNGFNPRMDREAELGLSVSQQERRYESLLLRRNAAILQDAGLKDPLVLSRLYEDPDEIDLALPVWNIVFAEMPMLDVLVPWDEVFAFREDNHTKQLTLQLRGWVRSMVSSGMPDAELEDEAHYLVAEYERHMRIARLKFSKSPLSFVVTGTADLLESALKLRLARLAAVVDVARARRVSLLEAEVNAPGKELALISDLRTKFGSRSS